MEIQYEGMIKQYKIFENFIERPIPVVGVPSGEYLELTFQQFDILQHSNLILWDEKIDSMTFDDRNFGKIMDVLNGNEYSSKKKSTKIDRLKEIENHLKDLGIKKYKINSEDNTVDIYQNVKIRTRRFVQLPFKFETIIGDFDISDCNLSTLRGCPDLVEGSFICSGNNLQDLKFGPNVVKKNYDCSSNNLRSLKGSPKKIWGDFICSNNALLDLKDGPIIVEGYYDCSNNTIHSLVGSPEIVSEKFDCCYNFLKSLEGSPMMVKYFDCSRNNIETLEGGPKFVDLFDCSYNKLKNLEGLPFCKKVKYEGNDLEDKTKGWIDM